MWTYVAVPHQGPRVCCASKGWKIGIMTVLIVNPPGHTRVPVGMHLAGDGRRPLGPQWGPPVSQGAPSDPSLTDTGLSTVTSNLLGRKAKLLRRQMSPRALRGHRAVGPAGR